MISSPGCECLGDVTPGAIATIALDGLASGDAEIVPLEIVARDSRLLRPRHVQRQAAADDQRRYRHDLSRFHVNFLSSSN